MAAFNFPPTDGEPIDGSFQYAPDGDDGIVYAWNGTTWQIVGGGSGGGGGASIEISPTPPTGAKEGDLWYNSNDGRLYVYYIQGNGQEQWVEAAPGNGFLGGEIDQSITTPVRAIASDAFDLATGPYWSCGAVDVPNPTNAVAGMTGVIRFTAAPTSWAANFKFPGGTFDEPGEFPAIVPFFVQDASTIEVGYVTQGIN